jgi:hypothetical protein
MKMGVLKFCVGTKHLKAFHFALSDKMYIESKATVEQRAGDC